MPPQETDPIEKKSYTKVLFVIGSLFLFVSLWAFYDELVSRRSWKDYQREFNTLELKKVESEYQAARQALDAEAVQHELVNIRLKIEAAEIRMEGEDVKQLRAELKERQNRFADAKQRAGFAKADLDELFYEWKHALEENKNDDAEKLKQRYRDLEERLKEMKQRSAEAEAAVKLVEDKLEGIAAELKKWKDEEKKLLEPLAKLEKKIDKIKSRGLDIQQVVIEDLGKGGEVKWGSVDRCESCHVAINQDGFENEKNPFKTHPFRVELFGKHPIEKFGCTTCHWGQGRATQIKGKPLEEGDFVHGVVEHWDKPLLRGDMLQSTCNKCHQDDWKLEHAPVYLTGKKLFWNLGCTGCHVVKGFENAPRVGPSLRKVGDKVAAEWLIRWIKNPRDYLPHTRMPRPPLDIEEPGQTEKVAAYLLQSSEKFDLPFGHAPAGNAAEGKKTFEKVGCYGCHILKDKGTGLAPALDRIMEKTTADWIYNWIQNPQAYNPEARMPNLRLTGAEAADVTAFLAQQGSPLATEPELRQTLRNSEKAKQGYLIVSQFGCYGCHNIKGFEEASKLSVELTAFGKKELPELDLVTPRFRTPGRHGRAGNFGIRDSTSPNGPPPRCLISGSRRRRSMPWSSS